MVLSLRATDKLVALVGNHHFLRSAAAGDGPIVAESERLAGYKREPGLGRVPMHH